jgi:hypothetical protein
MRPSKDADLFLFLRVYNTVEPTPSIPRHTTAAAVPAAILIPRLTLPACKERRGGELAYYEREQIKGAIAWFATLLKFILYKKN